VRDAVRRERDDVGTGRGDALCGLLRGRFEQAGEQAGIVPLPDEKGRAS
jgi:hypothetical protein